MNDTLNDISRRYSCRSYTDEPISNDQLEKICTAAISSPSAINIQPWKIVAVTNKELLAEMENEAITNLKNMEDQSSYNRIMSRGGKVFYNTPCMIFILTNTSASEYASLDCGIVSQTIALSATSLGLGNVICGMARLILIGEKADYFKEKIGIKDGYDFGLSVLVGNASQHTDPHKPNKEKLTFIK